MEKILVINPGSTSTKVAFYEGEQCKASENIKVDTDIVQKTDKIIEQMEMRTKQVKEFIDVHNIKLADLDLIAARGGMLPPCQGGAWTVNQLMIDVIKYAPKSQHASNLACLIGNALAEKNGIPVIVYDPLTVDEMDEISKMTGIPEIKLEPIVHVLNSRKVSRDTASKLGIDYEHGRFIVAHLGGGVSVTAHKDGKLIDFLSTNVGPMSPERCGGLPTSPLIDMCFSGKYTQREIKKMMIGKGGFIAWLGTSDALEVEKRIMAGDKLASKVYAAMGYQVAKAIGEMYVAVDSRPDAIIFTGALAKSQMLLKPIIERIKPMGRIEIVKGEREMEALAEGGLRVLRGVEKAKEYNLLPEGFNTTGEFYKWVKANNGGKNNK